MFKTYCKYALFLLFSIALFGCNDSFEENLKTRCVQNDFDACFDLGGAYAAGYKVKQDTSKSFEFVKIAAEGGHMLGQYNYASFFESDIIVKKNFETAYVWYKAASLKGYEKANVKALEIAAILTAEQVERANAKALVLP